MWGTVTFFFARIGVRAKFVALRSETALEVPWLWRNSICARLRGRRAGPVGTFCLQVLGKFGIVVYMGDSCVLCFACLSMVSPWHVVLVGAGKQAECISGDCPVFSSCFVTC